MKCPPQLYDRALFLRKKGWSYNEIRKEVPVAKSTLSLWLKSVRLSPAHRARLYTKKILVLARGASSQKERRQREVDEIIAKASAEIALPISKKTFRLFGAALYWAEGTKGKNFEVTNSDPVLIAFMAKWFQDVFEIPVERLRARINIYPQQNDKELKRFWSDLTGIPLENFGKSYVKPLSSGYKKNNLYYGTIKVNVSRGIDMKHRTFGWVQGALQELMPQIESTQRRWLSLRDNERPPVNLPS